MNLGGRQVNCPICGEEMISGEVCISGLGGTIYWVPKDFSNKHWSKTTQLKTTIEKEGGVIVSKPMTNISDPLVAYNCLKCRNVVINYK